MAQLELKAKSAVIRTYYAALEQLSILHASHEGAVRAAFANLLDSCGRKFKWTLVNEYEVRRGKRLLRVDGALVDPWSLTHGFWEAKDDADDLASEAKKKIAVGYPTDNILFQAPDRAILYQGGRLIMDERIGPEHSEALIDVLRAFFLYEPPQYEQWERAVADFRSRVPELAQALEKLIAKEREYPHFRAAFDRFAQLCRTSLNSRLTDEAVEKMLVQHILTERIFRKIFDNPDFIRRNAIAVEIERVIDKLTERSFHREQFLGGLDRFYVAIEATAGTIEDFAEKQAFLNKVYESFFQGFDAKTADTHGIVYTPQSLVRFMVRSVDELLGREFRMSLGDRGVHILDPFVGTGNFILHVMRQIPKTRLAGKYEKELHANEVMLLPYYIASMNIEHEYGALTNEYRPFEGLCLVDTFELDSAQHSFAVMAEANTARVDAQRKTPITVILGNPPYNAWQIDENDGNRNRKYSVVDRRIGETYAASSRATLVNALSDPYVRAFRWATDRLGDEGILAYVSNGSYVSEVAFDGMRHHLAQDFDAIYILDLGGNVRKNPKLSGTTHNVFGIQVGVVVGLFIRRTARADGRKAEIFYAKTSEDWRKGEKYRFLDDTETLDRIEWRRIEPDEKDTWLTEGLRADFDSFVPLAADSSAGDPPKAIFGMISNGLKSNNDAYVFGFQKGEVAKRANAMVDAYNDELLRWKAEREHGKLDDFLRANPQVIKWVRKTKRFFARGVAAQIEPNAIVEALYRPFVRTNLFFDRMFSEDVYSLPTLFGPDLPGQRALVISGVGMRSPFSALATAYVPEQHLCASTDAFQVLPLRRLVGDRAEDNVTDWALALFRSRYADATITKADVFHYVYGLLHHRDYRARYAANLKRELPRVPLAPDFRAFVRGGEALVRLHIEYEKQPEYPLLRMENKDLPLNWRVERMRLSKDRTQVVYNEFLTIGGIPAQALDYRLGNRSALEWLIDQYQVSTDKRSGIVNDPNREDDPDYIVRLIGQVITVSLETVRIVETFPALD